MNSLTTLERPAHPINLAPVLNRHGFTCTLVTFQPGTEAVLPDSHSSDAQLLFVVDGDIAVRLEGITTIVNRGDAHLIEPGTAPTVSARPGHPARVLRVEIPPRQISSPQIITPARP